MKNIANVIAYVLPLALSFPVFAQEAGQKVVTVPDAVSNQTVCMNKEILVYTPPGVTPGKKVPLMIFLHGCGERGNDIMRAGKHGPLKIIKNDTDFPFLLVAPQCLVGEDGRGWWKTDDLELLLAHLKTEYPVDESRMYLTG